MPSRICSLLGYKGNGLCHKVRKYMYRVLYTYHWFKSTGKVDVDLLLIQIQHKAHVPG